MSDNPDLNEASAPVRLASDTIERSTDFWLSDGSIVIQAENTLFRIHASLLSTNSSFFKDLSRLPQPADQPTIEGCAIMTVQDSRKDWENLLKWLYRPTQIVAEKFPLDILASMFRLAKKYELDDVRDCVITHLKSNIPTTIDSWVTTDWITWICGKETELVNLDEEFGMQKILPALYCQYLLTIHFYNHELFNGQFEVRANGTTFHLSPRSQQVILSAIIKIPSYIGHDLQPLCNGTANCTSVVVCTIARVDLIKEYLTYQEVNAIHFALFPASELERKYQDRLCPLCRHLAADTRERNWRRTWSALPHIFGMNKDWEDLVDFEE